MNKRLALPHIFFFASILAPLFSWANASLQSFSVTGSQSNDLFTSVGTQQASRFQNADAIWPVAVNLSFLSTLPPIVNLNFSDRPSVAVNRSSSQQRGPNGFVWSGHGGDCIVFLRQAPTSFKGQLACHNAGYQISKAANGSGLQLVRTLAGQGEMQSDVVATPPSLPLQSQQSAAPTQVDTTIDILVLYTSAVKTAAGGNAEALQLARDAVDQTQIALNHSTKGYGVTTMTPIATVNLVAAQEVLRTATGDFAADIFYLETDPIPMQMRNFWAADVVMYLTTNGTPGYSGLSNQPDYSPLYAPGPDYAPYAVAALLWNCALMVTEPGQPCYDTTVFPHEFAHNLGANHNTQNSPWPMPTYPPYPTSPPMPVQPDAFGHYGNVLSTGDGYHTIMSYFVSSGCHSPCPRVLYYSNPDVTTDAGFKTGVAGAQNNASVIQSVASITAQYRLNLGRIFYNGFEGAQ